MSTTPSPFEIATERRDGARIVRVSGELDLGTQERFAASLTEEATGGEPVVVDLAGCDFIDSSGVRALIVGLRACEEAGCSLSVAAPGDQVRRILDMTGLDASVPVHDSVEAAIGAASG